VNRQIGVGDSKYVIAFDPLLTGHVIRRNGKRYNSNSRTDRRRVFILGGKVGHVTRHVRQLFKVKRSKVKGQGHKVTRKKFTLSRALALVTRESKRP